MPRTRPRCQFCGRRAVAVVARYVDGKRAHVCRACRHTIDTNITPFRIDRRLAK